MVFATSRKRMGSLDSNSISMKPPHPETFSKECSTVLNFTAKQNITETSKKYNVRSEVGSGYLSKVGEAFCMEAQPSQRFALLAAARDRGLKKIDSHGSITKLVVYAPDKTGFAIYKAAKSTRHSCCKLLSDIRLCLIRVFPKCYQRLLCHGSDVANELIPLYLCATIGTTAIISAADCLVKLGQVS